MVKKEHDLATLEGKNPALQTLASDARPAVLSPAPRILDASASFDLEEMAEWQVPSTIPGERDAEDCLGYRALRVLEPGQRVGRYLTEEILGRGGMGLVLKARDDLLQREVALKVILPEYLSSNPSAGLRFLREAEIVARLEHPHIIRVLDAGLDGGIAFLAFEYVHGKSYSALGEDGPKDVEQALDLVLPVLSAVARAHQQGVVHGDLKPTNLLLGRDHAGRPHPWVLDFGVSFFAAVDAGMDPMRKKITGTPGYLAPEWLDGQGVDARADCFSLGCVLYELLAKRPPFAGITRLSQALTAAKRREYPRLGSYAAVTSELEELVDHAMDPDPATRFESAREMARALLRFAGLSTRNYYAIEFGGA